MAASNETDFLLEERSKTENRLIEKAWNDPAFKAELLKDPAAVLAKEMGIDSMPGSVSVKVVEDNADSITIVIPHNSVPTPEELGLDADENVDEELNVSQLESVAGGTTYVATGVSDVIHVYKWNVGSLGLYGLDRMSKMKDRMTQVNTMQRIGQTRINSRFKPR